jgi:hypothetical protein
MEETTKSSRGKESVADFLRTRNTAPPAAGPTIPRVAGHEDLVDQVAAAHLALMEAEEVFRGLEVQLLDAAGEIYADSSDDFAKSYRFGGRSTPGVLVTYQDRFSAIDIDEEANLRKWLGEADYAELFEEKRDIRLTKTDDATINLIRTKLGAHMFDRVFQVKLTIACKPDMDRVQFELPKRVRGLLKQAKASVKPVKE